MDGWTMEGKNHISRSPSSSWPLRVPPCRPSSVQEGCTSPSRESCMSSWAATLCDDPTRFRDSHGAVLNRRRDRVVSGPGNNGDLAASAVRAHVPWAADSAGLAGGSRPSTKLGRCCVSSPFDLSSTRCACTYVPPTILEKLRWRTNKQASASDQASQTNE